MVDHTFTNLDRKDLSVDQEKVVSAALSALNNSYSPYSSFQVGTALLLDNGELFLGSNQENIAYPSGICAERSALFSYGSSGSLSAIIMLAVIAKHRGDNSFAVGAPCGACRQVMLEYELKQQRPFEVIFFYDNQFVIASSARSLLPFYFHMKRPPHE